MKSDSEVLRNYSWEESTSPADPEWDAFVAGSEHAHQEQTTAWGRLKKRYGWHPVRIVARCGGSIVAGAQLLELRLGPFWRIGYLCYGPICDFTNSELTRETAIRIEQWSKRRYLYLVVGLPYGGSVLEPVFTELGFECHTGRLPPYLSMDATVVIDLSKDLETIFDVFHPSKRKKLKRSYKSDLRVRHGGAADAEIFRSLMWNLCAMRGTRPTPPQGDFFSNAFQEFPPDDLQLLILEDSRGPIRAFFSFRCGDWLRCWKVGGTERSPQKNPSERLMWEAIKFAKEHGVRWFDLVSVDRETVLRTGGAEKAADDWQPDSTTMFKLSFGGDVIFLPHQLIKVYNPVVRQSLRVGADRVLKGVVGRMLYSLRARTKGNRSRGGTQTSAVAKPS